VVEYEGFVVWIGPRVVTKDALDDTIELVLKKLGDIVVTGALVLWGVTIFNIAPFSTLSVVGLSNVTFRALVNQDEFVFTSIMV
jgi:hypothetical protein